VKRNPSIENLHAPYLFPLMAERKRALLEREPEAKIISLGIGDTTAPLPAGNVRALTAAAKRLGTAEGYSGYGAEQGAPELRASIAKVIYGDRIEADEIFVGDGSKCDIGRLQVLFGPDAVVAIQDPAYPVYVFTSVIMGQTGEYDHDADRYDGITYLPCTAENGFFPDLDSVPAADVVFFCSPNNPTGAIPSREQLEQLVLWAKRNGTIIVYDAAYALYIQDDTLPRSIYEIAGAREVAIETGSFSKTMGYTGVRLGWTVVPEELCYDDGSPVRDDWRRVVTTYFNGASNIVQEGGIQALSEEGMDEMRGVVRLYLDNAALLREALLSMGVEPFGGVHAPFLWVPIPGRKSWEVFDELLEDSHLLATPGVGFGPAGEGYMRFSAFGQRDHIQEAAERLVKSPALRQKTI